LSNDARFLYLSLSSTKLERCERRDCLALRRARTEEESYKIETVPIQREE